MSYSWLLNTNATEEHLSVVFQQLQRKGFSISEDGKRLESSYIYIMSSIRQQPIMQKSILITASIHFSPWKFKVSENGEWLAEIMEAGVFLISLLDEGLLLSEGSMLHLLKEKNAPVILNTAFEDADAWVEYCVKQNLEYEFSNLGIDL